MSTTSAYISSTFHFMKSVIWLWDSIGTIHVTGEFSAKDNWSETLIPEKLASRLIRGKNSVNNTIGRKILSELTEDPTYVNPTYPRFVVLKTINIIGTAAFCPSWAKIRLTRVRLTRETLSNNNPCPSSPSSTILRSAYMALNTLQQDWLL